MTTSTTALLVVDVQRDYLARPGLVPDAETLVAAVARVLGVFRTAGAPVAHVHTVVRADGSDALPHWRAGTLHCVAGTDGAAPPPPVAPAAGEYVAQKQQYRGFADPGLHRWLRDRRVGRVVIAGVYEHACVAETALDALEAGYEVVIVGDAVGSDRPPHAALTREWLGARAVHYVEAADVGALPWEQPDPSPVRAVAARASTTQREWAQVPAPARADLLDAWAAVCEARTGELTAAIVDEVSKPVRAARDEVHRAVGHIRTAARLVRETDRSGTTGRIADGVAVVHAPIGVGGLLMPWNNPLALPVGKIAPALAFGNAVVCKPAPEATATARVLHDTLVAAGIPADLVGIVTGGVDVGLAVVREPLVRAVTLTGSVTAGRAVGVECARLGKPFQGELGGNNAAIVCADADLDHDVPLLVQGAFSFAGQRCTAIRRLVVDAAVVDEVCERARAAMDALVVGDPHDEGTDVGPLVSQGACDRVARTVDDALAAGVALVHRLDVPAFPGAWYPPTLLRTDDPTLPIVTAETFGPVLVVQPARDLDHALELADAVEHGLLGAVCTTTSATRDRVVAAMRVGIVQDGAAAPAIHADAPFGGWKASGAGPPEHGEWDRSFWTRVQARYGDG